MKSIQLLEVTMAIPLVLSLLQASEQQKPQADSQFETVSICQLTKEWKKYDHKTVRVEAIYHGGFEASEIYDPACPTSDQTTWVALFPYGSPSPTPPELKEKFNKLLKQDGRVRLTVVGEFDGPKKVDVPPGLTPEGADAMRATNSRYGHQNRWEFQFVFSKVEKVEAVPASDPWPRWANEKEK